MARLRILSWNLRTFANYPLRPADLRQIAEIMLQSQADIVCVQEVQTGEGVIGRVGAPISAASLHAVGRLYQTLYAADPGGAWGAACSGANSGFADHMRDAYAFFWKTQPTKSAFAHAEAPDGIQGMTEPVVLRQQGKDAFPGRRPGMLTVHVHVGDAVAPVNIISYHAPTPVNRFSKGDGAGYGINSLATLAEIGGGMQKGTGRSWEYVAEVMPLPQIDTVVVGDFNYSMDQKWAQFTYNNLLSNYQACVSDPKNVVLTTYAPDAQQALRLISAYDNIFVLRKHSTFTPALTAASSGCIDFIQQEAAKLGQAVGVKDLGTEVGWYVVHLDRYKKQLAVRGLSDHIPVWAEFTLDATDSTAQHVEPTSGADNNCLLHAMFGAPVNGMYSDPAAGGRRDGLVTALTGYLTNRAIPPGGSSALIREAIVSAMLNQFAGEPDCENLLRVLLAHSDINPFDDGRFDEMFARYIQSIANGRMLWVQEAALLACLADIPLTLHYPDRAPDTFNPDGHQPPVEIFHRGLHFSRWLP